MIVIRNLPTDNLKTAAELRSMKEKELDNLDKAPMYRDKNFPSESEPTSSSGTRKDRRLAPLPGGLGKGRKRVDT